MNAIIKNIAWEQLAYFIIFLGGTFLFSYNITETSLNPDELSAIKRADFNSLAALFKYSIPTDAHPPLIQVFLYYWIQLVGTSSFLIKLPFLLMGICSISLMYQLAKEWFGKRTALLALSFFVSIQFTILYAQMARPYISGLFLSLLCALYWTRIIRSEVKTSHYLGYIISAILLSYNHYYGTIQVGTMGLVGLFFVAKNNTLKYLISNVFVLILFLVYFPFLWVQMNIEGLNYVNEPDSTFLFDFLLYLFQFSYPSLLLVLSVVLYSIVNYKKETINQFTVIALLFFILPFLIGFVYSIAVRPILLYRSLIHATPFLILFFFSFASKLKFRWAILWSVLIISTNVYTLTQHRKHYEITEKGIAKAAVLNTMELIKDEQKPAVLFNLTAHNLNYYYQYHQADFEYMNIVDSLPTIENFRKTIESLKNDVLATANIPANFTAIIETYFPYYQWIDYGHNFNYYVFAKNPLPNQPVPLLDTIMTFDEKNDDNNLVTDSTTNNVYYQFNQLEEWGTTLTVPIGQLLPHNHYIIECSMAVLPTHKLAEGTLVFEIKDADKQVAWRGEKIIPWLHDTANWNTVHYRVQLNKIMNANQLTPHTKLLVYFWNQAQEPVAVDNFSVRIFNGNKLIYGLLEEIPQ